jgi:hypothetical protein
LECASNVRVVAAKDCRMDTEPCGTDGNECRKKY